MVHIFGIIVLRNPIIWHGVRIIMNGFNQFQVRIYKDFFKESHLHTELELLYLVEGSADVRIKDKLFSMKREDIIVINNILLF